MIPNINQTASLIRWLMSISGPLGAWLVSHGMTADQLSAFSSALIGIIAASPPFISLIWGLYAHTRQAKIKAVAAMPEVKQVVVVPVDQTMKGLINDRDIPKVTG